MPRPRRHARSAPSPAPLCLALLLLAAAATEPAAAQSDIAGTVRDGDDGAPVAAAAVRIVGLGLTRMTDADGRFRFENVPAGPQRIVVERIGFASRDDELAVPEGDALLLDVRLARSAVDLLPITVVARPRKLLAVGFYDRLDRGQGTFFTRDDLEREKISRMGDLLARVPGLRRTVGSDGNSRVSVRGTKTVISNCSIQYFMDGVRAEIGVLSIDAVPADDVEGVEVYRGAAQLPSQFNSGRSMCGAVLIWTR